MDIENRGGIGNIVTKSRPLTRQDRRLISDVKKMNAGKSVFIVLDDLDFSWNREEANCFMGRWRIGHSLKDIGCHLRPDLHPEDALDEVLMLAIHLYRQKYILQRPYMFE